MKRLTVVLAVLGIVCLLQPVYAQSGGGAGTLQSEWLVLDVGARPTAMGKSYTAIGDDASSLFWNPAGIVGAKKTEFMFQYGVWFDNMGYHAASLVLPMGKSKDEGSARNSGSQGYSPYRYGAGSPYERYSPQSASSSGKKGLEGSAIGLGLIYFDSGAIPYSEDETTPTGTFTVNFMCAMLSYSQSLGDTLAIGVTGKMINETYDIETQSYFLGDAGLVLSAGSIKIGASMQNVGGDAPQNIRAGVGFLLGPLLLNGDVSMTPDTTQMSVGGEMSLGGIMLRAGMILGMDEATYGTGALLAPGISVGFGVDTDSLCLDLALVDYGELLGSGVGPLNTPLIASVVFKF